MTIKDLQIGLSFVDHFGNSRVITGFSKNPHLKPVIAKDPGTGITYYYHLNQIII